MVHDGGMLPSPGRVERPWRHMIHTPLCRSLESRVSAMPAYWVARARITDPIQYKKYIMEGPEDFHRFVVIEFPTLEQGVACFESPEYQAAAAFRRNGGGIVENVIVEGGDATPR